MFNNNKKIHASEYHRSLDISKSISRDKSRVFITIEVENDGLAEMILENIKKNIWIGICKNCERRMIINSATHQICSRCRNKDKTQGSGNIEI